MHLLQWLPLAWQRTVLDVAAMPLGRRLVRGATASLMMTGASMLLGIANSVLLGRLLGPEGFGLYSFAMLLISVASVPFWFGMSTLLTRETGRVVASGTRRDMGVLLNWSYRWTVRVAFVATVAAAALLWFFGSLIGPVRQVVCLMGLPLIGLSMLMPINSTLLRGVGGLVRSQFCDLIARPSLSLLAILLLVAVFGHNVLTANAGLLAQTLAVAGASALSGYWFLRGWREMPLAARADAEPYVGRFRFRGLLTFSAYASLATFYGSIDGLLLNSLDGNATLGIYRIAMVGVQLISGIPLAINTIAQPSIASLHAAGDHHRLQRLLTTIARVTAVLEAFPVAVLALFGQPLLSLGFGPGYAAGAPALAISAIGQLLMALAGPVASLLTLTGNERTALLCLLAGTICSGVLCLLLIPSLGMSGAAIATTSGGLLWTGLMALSERRLTGLTSTVFGVR